MARMARLLVTGFERFPGVPVNISEQLVRGWRERPPPWPFGDMRFEVLPTCYQAAGEGIARLLFRLRSRLLSPARRGGHAVHAAPRRFALNVDDAAVPDASGDTRRGSAIVPGGPLALATAVDIVRLERALAAAAVRSVPDLGLRGLNAPRCAIRPAHRSR